MGVALRPAGEADLGFLRALYGELRAAEMAFAPWTPIAKTAFLNSQFTLQHQHFTAIYPRADFLVVERHGAPIGRLYVDWGKPDVLIVEIGLLTRHRGLGVGSALLDWAADEARRRGAARITLHVVEHNTAARRLYERRGYRAESIDGAHILMTQAL